MATDLFYFSYPFILQVLCEHRLFSREILPNVQKMSWYLQNNVRQIEKVYW